MQTDKTIRISHDHTPEAFAAVIGTLASADADIISITTVHVGATRIERDVKVAVKSDEEIERMLSVIRTLPDVSIGTVTDEVMRMHEGGKLMHVGRMTIRNQAEMREVYTPGVAKVCRAIARDPSLARRYTTAGNTVAVVSNGSRVLGLGDIGPLASLPVMEAKAMFYGQLVGLNAVPIVLELRGVEDFVQTVAQLSPAFAGIHLEDIASPDCIQIERQLIQRLSIPVMHDDQHGTAVVALAAATNLLRDAGRDITETVFAQVGLGAAGLAIATLAKQAGFKRVIGTDRDATVLAAAEAKGIQPVSFEDCIACEGVLSLTTGKPGLITPQMVRPGQIILALSNPQPEIEPAVARQAGAAGALDGRMVNNLLGYPGLFKGAITAGAHEITTAMKLQAAQVIASCAPKGEVLPDPLSRSVHEAVAQAVMRAVSGPGS